MSQYLTTTLLIFFGAWLGLFYTPAVIGALIRVATLGGTIGTYVQKHTVPLWAWGWAAFLLGVLR